MSNDKIFTNEIEIPEKVQNKANKAFDSIRKESKTNLLVERIAFIKRFVAVIVALIVIFCSINLIDYLKHKSSKNIDTDKISMESEEQQSGYALSKNLFGITAYAAELKAGAPVPLSFEAVNGCVLSTTFLNGPYSFELKFNMDFTIEGDNISTVTYAVKNGVFVVDYPEDQDIVYKGVKDDEYSSRISNKFGEYYDAELDEKVTCAEEYYSTFTLKYEEQRSKNTYFYVAFMSDDRENYENIVVRGNGVSVKEQQENYKKLLNDRVITITVEYADGTQASQDLVYDTLVEYNAYGYPFLWYTCRCAEDESAPDCVVDENLNILSYDLEEYKCLEQTRVAKTDSGIQYGDKLVVELEKSKNSDNTDWEALGEQEFYLTTSNPNLFYPEQNPEESWGSDYDQVNEVYKLINTIVGQEVGTQFIVNDGVAYRYTVKSYESWDTGLVDSYENYMKNHQ